MPPNQFKVDSEQLMVIGDRWLVRVDDHGQVAPPTITVTDWPGEQALAGLYGAAHGVHGDLMSQAAAAGSGAKTAAGMAQSTEFMSAKDLIGLFSGLTKDGLGVASSMLSTLTTTTASAIGTAAGALTSTGSTLLSTAVSTATKLAPAGGALPAPGGAAPPAPTTISTQQNGGDNHARTEHDARV